MLDLRLKNQRYEGFYVWKKPQDNIWAVGLNGTSCHTTIAMGPNAKEEILAFINANQKYRNW